MPHLFRVLLPSVLLILPACTGAETSTPVAEVSGSALLRQAEDLAREVDRIIERLMEQGFTIEIGQLKAMPVPDSDFLDLRVPITVSKSAVFEPTLSALAKALDSNAEPDALILYRILRIPLVHASNRDYPPPFTFIHTGIDPASKLWVKKHSDLSQHAFDSLADHRLTVELHFSDSERPTICQVMRRPPVAVVKGEVFKPDAGLQKALRQINKNVEPANILVFAGEWNDYGPLTVRDMDEKGRLFILGEIHDMGPEYKRRAAEQKGEQYWQFLEAMRSLNHEFGRILAFIYFRDTDDEMINGKEEVRIPKTLVRKLEKIQVKFRRKNVEAASQRGDSQWCSAGPR